MVISLNNNNSEFIQRVFCKRTPNALTSSTSMLLHDVTMTSHCCQRYAECLVTTLLLLKQRDFQAGQCAGTPRPARATVELLRQETPKFLAPNLWPPNSTDLNPVDYEIWAVMQHRVYHRQIHSRLIDVCK